MNELQHHGILGQKCGIRRFQNKDGSLTAAGRKRYNKELSDVKKYGNSVANAERYKRQVDPYLKPDQKLLVPSDFKNEFSKAVEYVKKNEKMMNTRYKDLYDSYKVSMDDGYDYIVTHLKDNSLGGVIEYYSLIGKTNKSASSEKKTYFKENKDKLMNNAKVNNKFDLDFLEYTQNEPWQLDYTSESARKKALSEYSKYLDDPEKYIQDNYRK